MAKIRAAVIGATGYTGAELLRLLLGHPEVEVSAIVGSSTAGRPVGEVLPSFAGLIEGTIESFDAAEIADRAQVAFACLPHGASAEVVRHLRGEGVIVYDLSADFRLKDRATYESWYQEHLAPELLGRAVYGLPELHREALRKADLVAVPGCYPTSAILPAAPLMAAGLVSPSPIIIDAKSGVSGAGRKPSLSTHLPEAAEGIRAYKTAGRHRHTPEIEQELSALLPEALPEGERRVSVSFSPHLVPMSRGILSTVYLFPKEEGLNAAKATQEARAFFASSPSVYVHPPGAHPDTLWVRGSNRAHIAYTEDSRAGLLVAQCVIDNLIKGSGGQAIQCMNLRMGLEEGVGLRLPGAWP